MISHPAAAQNTVLSNKTYIITSLQFNQVPSKVHLHLLPKEWVWNCNRAPPPLNFLYFYNRLPPVFVHGRKITMGNTINKEKNKNRKRFPLRFANKLKWAVHSLILFFFFFFFNCVIYSIFIFCFLMPYFLKSPLFVPR